MQYGHKTKAVEIYTKFFLKDRITPFSQRIKKAKKDAIEYIDKKFSQQKEPDELFYWEMVKKYAERI